MALTSILGSSDAYLGNILLGSAGAGDGDFNEAIGLDCEADISESGLLLIESVITLQAEGDFTTPGGLVIFLNTPIEGFSNLEILPGWGYVDTFSIDGETDITFTDDVIKISEVSLDAISDFTIDDLLNSINTLSIAGQSDLDIQDNQSYTITTELNVLSTIYVEHLYNFLMLVVNETTTLTADRYTFGTHNPSSAGNLTLTCTGVFNRTITQLLELSHSGTYKKPTEIIQGLAALNHSVTFVRVRNRSATNTLTLSHEVEGFRGIDHSLSLIQSVTGTRILIRTVSQTLSLVNTVSRENTINRNVSQTLTYNPVNLIRTQVNGFEYILPTVCYSLVPRKCLVILSTPSRSIVLPCPDFGNTQNLQSSLTLKRSMTGDTFTYVKQTKIQKLKYPFTIWTHKYIELRQFFIDFNSSLITLNNWKGETWLVYFANNPIEFSANERFQPKGEKYNVTLEFEGVKIC